MMGYRHYFYKIDKQYAEVIRNLPYKNLLDKFSNEDGCVGIRDIFQEKAFEFGKYLAEADDIYKIGMPFFNDGECMKYFYDEKPYEVGKAGILKAIEIYKNKIIPYYDDLLLDTKDEITDEMITSQEKMKKDVKDKLFWWNTKYMLNVDEKDKYSITESWLYEHQIFNLIHLLKTIDWETEAIIFFGV